jgi:6-phosphogluconate dehydrogenase
MTLAHTSVIGLGVMGANLARNFAHRGYTVGVYNRTGSVTDEFLAAHAEEGKFLAAKSLEELVRQVARPRSFIIMVKAGAAVDAVIDGLTPFLEAGDVIIDGGNTYFRETQEREARLKTKGIHFLGMGISGGEEGALKGPSMMPGGERQAWESLRPMFEKIAAQADGPCTTYVGPDGSGHFVKMVHNGIEYADMQLLAEVYHFMREICGSEAGELAQVFAKWNAGALSSYLVEITAEVLRKPDDQGAGYLVDAILDKAGQKGTGVWTAKEAFDLGVAAPTITAAVEARVLSSLKDQRVKFEKIWNEDGGSPSRSPEDLAVWDTELASALYAAKILCYAQGFDLIATASRNYEWNINLASLAKIWKGGCIIRARFLDEIARAYSSNPKLSN